jgi:predicted translin family RNA/ssDNA-binding protein
MNITHINRIKEALTKKHSLREGIIDYIFGKMMVNKLSKDKDFVAMATKLDRDMQKIRDKVEQLKKDGKPIPNSYKVLLNIK